MSPSWNVGALSLVMDALDFFHPPCPDTLGLLKVRARAGAITAIEFVEREDQPARPDVTTGLACRQLAEYFAGIRRVFDLPLAPRGTEFQQLVWAALVGIPYGETRSYGELARQLGRPGAQRAVGAANGRNSIAVVIPCHRVVASDGGLGGYSAGVARKQWLLEREGVPTGSVPAR